MYAGIDYGLGRTNIDLATGIRFGVIPQHEVGEAWYDSAEAEYGPPTCGHCGHEADELSAFGDTFADGIPEGWKTEPHECDEYACTRCERVFGSESAFGDDPIAWAHSADGIVAECGGSGDIFITKSPYFTHAAFCSPCAPGACYLMSPVEDGPRAYCFPHSWYEDGRAPYPVYRVSDGALIESADME